MKKIKEIPAVLCSGESGISSVEYALLLAFVAAGVAIAAGQLNSPVEIAISGSATCAEATATTGSC